MSRSVCIVATLIMLNFVSAMGIVYSKYISRSLFVESRQLRADIDALNVDWGRLQLEQSTHAKQGRIESIARKKLGMLIPEFQQRKMVVN